MAADRAGAIDADPHAVLSLFCARPLWKCAGSSLATAPGRRQLHAGREPEVARGQHPLEPVAFARTREAIGSETTNGSPGRRYSRLRSRSSAHTEPARTVSFTCSFLLPVLRAASGAVGLEVA